MKFILFSFASLLLGLLLHTPSSPDQHFSLKILTGSFLIFVFFGTSVWSWGSLLLRALKLPRHSYLQIALGAAAASTVTMAFGHLGFIGTKYRVLFFAWSVFGVVADYFFHRTKVESAPKKWRLNRLKSPAGLIIIFLAVVGLADTFIASQPAVGGTDEFRYHLVGPKIWFDAGRVFMPSQIPIAMQCTNWEYLYLFGLMLLGGQGALGLIEVQLFAQWTHLLVGYLGAALAFYKLIAPYALSRLGAFLVLAAVFTCSDISQVAVSAKNDWGAVLWTVSGLCLLFNEAKTQRSIVYLTSGILLGFGFTTKFTTAFTALPALIAWAFIHFRSIKISPALALVAFGGILSSAPILLRNYIHIENPVYPAMGSVFKSFWIGSTWTWYQNQYEVKDVVANLAMWPKTLLAILRSFPLLIVLPAYPLLAKFGRTRTKRLWPFWVAGIIGFALYMLKAKPGFGSYEHFVRVGSVAPLLMMACSVITVEMALVYFRRATANFLLGMLAIFLITKSSVNWKILDYILIPQPANIAIREFLMGGDAKAWLRQNVGPQDLIVSTGENQVYYVSHLKIVVIPEQPELDEQTLAERNPKDMIRIVRSYGARYLIDVNHWKTSNWNLISTFFKQEIMQNPASIVFTGRDSIVVDLVKLEEDAELACIKPHLKELHNILGPAEKHVDFDLYSAPGS